MKSLRELFPLVAIVGTLVLLPTVLFCVRSLPPSPPLPQSNSVPVPLNIGSEVSDQDNDVFSPLLLKGQDLKLQKISNLNKLSKGTFPLTRTSFYGITSRFGPRTIFGYAGFHSGIDLGAPMGATIRAWKGGKVDLFSQPSGCGNGIYIVSQVNPKGAEIRGELYCHLSRYAVSDNTYVEEGDVIGFVGSTGRSSGPHLHFGLYQNQQAVNPYWHLKQSKNAPNY